MVSINNKQRVKKDTSYKLNCKNSLTSADVNNIRQEIEANMHKDWNTIYIDTKDVVEVDLSGINEIIHTAYYLSSTSKELIVIYRKNSNMAKWIETTSLNRFVNTALLP